MANNYANIHRKYKIKVEEFDQICRKLRTTLFQKQNDLVTEMEQKKK